MKRMQQQVSDAQYNSSLASCAPHFTSAPNPKLKSSSLWLLPPQLTYGWRGNSQPCERVVFHFASVPKEIREVLSDQRWLLTGLNQEERQQIRTLASELKDPFEKPHQYSHLFFERALLDLAILALKDQKQNRQVPLQLLKTERVERVISWYVVNMRRNPTVEEAAQVIYTTPTHLRRLFKAVKNMSPHSVFRDLQIKRATELLSTTPDTIEQIASSCGFNSTTDFARVFRKSVGTTADKWRRRTLEVEPQDLNKNSPDIS
jgi:AraC family transcriptional regulator